MLDRIRELLGNLADNLLGHRCHTIPKTCI
jgi:hypothetical protein